MHGWKDDLKVKYIRSTLKSQKSTRPIQGNVFLLKAVDTIGNCQRLAFTVGVSQHVHKTKNL